MAFEKQNKNAPFVVKEPEEKRTPAFLREDYLYKATGELIKDMSQIREGEIYEIKCYQCEMSIRSQGQNIRDAYLRMQDKGCLGCGNRNLVINKVDMSKAPKVK